MDGPKFKIENDILKGNEVPYKIQYPSLGAYVLDHLENNAEFVGQIDAVTGEKYTYQKMRDRSVRCALWMKSQGLLPGDLVTICSHNQPDVVMPCFAALYLGAIFSPWGGGLNRTEFRYLLNLVKPKIAFVSEMSVAALAEAAREANLNLKIIVFGQFPGFLDFESIIAEPRAEDVEKFRCADIESLENIASMICSSGTTGLPKGVALSHRAWLTQISSAVRGRLAGGSFVVFSSPSWISWSLGAFMNFTTRVTDIISPPFEEHSACQLIEKYKPTGILFASSMVNRLLKSGVLKKYDISSPVVYFWTGAPLPHSAHEAFAKFIPKSFLTSGYGMTEIGGSLTMRTPRSKPGSCGQILANAQLKVIDLITGKKLGPNQRGELLLKTSSMMSSYYNNPEATAESIDEEGWLHSGDIGYYDEDGEIYILDRLKELMKYRGYQVSPVEIENVILSHPGVKEVAVVGIPHPVDDEHPVALVVKAENFTATGKEVTETELMDLVAAELSDAKRLRGGVRFLDSLPKSPSGKIRRNLLRDLATKSTVRSRRKVFFLPKCCNT